MHQCSVKQHFVPIFAEIHGQRPGQVAPVLSPSAGAARALRKPQDYSKQSALLEQAFCRL